MEPETIAEDETHVFALLAGARGAFGPSFGVQSIRVGVTETERRLNQKSSAGWD